MDAFFVFVSIYVIILPVLILALYFYNQKVHASWKIIIFFAISLSLSFILSLIAREMYVNPRPFVVGNFTPLIPHDSGNGFPSDHTLLASAIAASLWFFNKRVGLLVFAITILIGVSRVYVGVHHPIDIIGSICISSFSAFVASIVIKNKESAIMKFINK